MVKAWTNDKMSRQALFVLAIFCVHQALAYKEAAIESDKLCSPIKRLRTVELKYNEASSLAIQETRYFNNWPGTYQFDCTFKIDAVSKDGIAVVIQKLDLRRNKTSGECIDYIQFIPREDKRDPSDKICGYISTASNDERGKYIDHKGDLLVRIFVEKLPLLEHQSIDIDVVFTAYKMCANNPPKYKPCSPEMCIWEGFFNDQRVNCPFSDCKDEFSCAVNRTAVAKRNPVGSPVYLSLMMFLSATLMVMACCFMLLCKCRGNSSHPTESPECDQQIMPFGPSAPTTNDDPKDQPPSYKDLFPEDD